MLVLIFYRKGKMKMKMINDEMLSLEDVVVIHNGLVYSVANKYRALGEGVGLEVADLTSVGFIGLIKAYKRFDSDYKNRFSTYAMKYIKYEVYKEINKQQIGLKYSRDVKDLGRKIRKDGNEECTYEELTELYGETLRKVKHAINFIHYRGPAYLDAPFKASATENYHEPINLIDTIGIDEDLTVITTNDFLNKIPERVRTVFNMYTKEGRTQREIGEKCGMSQVQVSNALLSMRDLYNEYLFGEKEELKGEDREHQLKEARRLLEEGKMSIMEIHRKTGVGRTTLYRWRNEVTEKVL